MAACDLSASVMTATLYKDEDCKVPDDPNLVFQEGAELQAQRLSSFLDLESFMLMTMAEVELVLSIFHPLRQIIHSNPVP
jgi:hypothetical protein